MTLEQVLQQVLRCGAVSIISPVLRTHLLYIHHRGFMILAIGSDDKYHTDQPVFSLREPRSVYKEVPCCEREDSRTHRQGGVINL
jgi:hypothetical protein